MSITYISLFILRKRISKYRYILVSIAIITALLIGAIGHIYVLNNVVETNMNMLTNRGYIWHYSNELIKENFIFGYGPDNLYYNFPQLNEHKSIYMPNDLIDKPHNMYLQVMLDIGIFGLIGFMIILVTLLLKSNKAIDLEKDTYKNTYFKALILVILAYMLQGIVNDNTIAVQSVIYLLMGIGASLIKQTLTNAKLPITK
jgi:O-antigen ligase